MIGRLLDMGLHHKYDALNGISEEVSSLLEALEKISTIESPEDQRDLACLRFGMISEMEGPLRRVCDKVKLLSLQLFGGNQPEGFWEFAQLIRDNLISSKKFSDKDYTFMFLDRLKKIMSRHPENCKAYFEPILEEGVLDLEEFNDGYLETLSKMDSEEMDNFFNKFMESSPRLLLFLKHLDPDKRKAFLREANDLNELVAKVLKCHESPNEIIRALRMFDAACTYVPNVLIEDGVGIEWLQGIIDSWEKLKDNFTQTELQALIVIAYSRWNSEEIKKLIALARSELKERGFDKDEDFWEVVWHYSATSCDEQMRLSEALFDEICALEKIITRDDKIHYNDLCYLVSNQFGGPPNVMLFLEMGILIRKSNSPYLVDLIRGHLISWPTKTLQQFLALSNDEQEACVLFVKEYLPRCTGRDFSFLLDRWEKLQSIWKLTDQERKESLRALSQEWSNLEIKDLEWLWKSDVERFQFVFNSQNRFHTSSSEAFCFLVNMLEFVPSRDWESFAAFIEHFQIGRDKKYRFQPMPLFDRQVSFEDLRYFLTALGRQNIEITTFIVLCGCSEEKLRLIRELITQMEVLQIWDFDSLILQLSQVNITTLERVKNGEIIITSWGDLLALKKL